MLFLDFSPRPPSTPVLVHAPVEVRTASFSDYDEWTDLRRESRAHLTAWEPAWRESELTRAAYNTRLRQQWRDIKRGVSLPMLVSRQHDGVLVGGVTLSNIRYGAARAAVVGYWIGAPHVRKGYARAALQAVLAHAFGTLSLNRVEAACQPGNAASTALLESSGFSREGLARDYLKINGAWRDHVLYAITAGDFAQRKQG